MRKVKIYGTIGPACADPMTLKRMFEEGMDGIRLNLSHATLEESAESIAAFHKAAEMYIQELSDNTGTIMQYLASDMYEQERCDKSDGKKQDSDRNGHDQYGHNQYGHNQYRHDQWKPELLIDMQGPELRIGKLDEPIVLNTGDLISVDAIPFSNEVLDVLGACYQTGDKTDDQCHSDKEIAEQKTDQEILLDDGKILLKTELGNMYGAHFENKPDNEQGTDKELCNSAGDEEKQSIALRVIRGGILESRKSVTLPGCQIDSPALTELDKYNISKAKEYGVTGLMQPFVRGKEDLIEVRRVLDESGCSDIRLMGKIESQEGVAKAEEIIPFCDEVVIARGDLGNSMDLWQLPAVQKRLSAACRKAGRDFLVVTQMLESMNKRQVPTRAEVSDIFNAVLDGAVSVMLTGETATGDYPIDSIIYMARTVREAEKFIE